MNAICLHCRNLLSVDLELRSEVVEHAAVKIAGNINNLSAELRRLFLVEDYVDSLKVKYT